MTTPRELRHTAWALAAIVVVAMNLRPAVVAVAPLLDEIRGDVGLTAGAAGLLTTIPVLCFGVFSAVVPRLSRRFGLEFVVFIALIVLAIGTVSRLVPSVVALFAGTVLVGIAIAIGNVMLPSLVKAYFPDRVGAVTSLYTMALSGGAALAAGATVPLAIAFGFDWRRALAVWGLVAMAALLLYLPRIVRREITPVMPMGARGGPSLWKSRLAWSIVLLLGFQSFVYYSVTAWLPDYLISNGMRADEAGWALSLVNILGTISCLVVPVLAGRLRRQRALALVISAAAFAGILALVAVPAMPYLGVTLFGFAQGGSISLALVLIVLRTPDSSSAAQLSGMVQGLGYCIAAAGPFLIGLVREFSGGWVVPFGVLLLAVVFQGMAGFRAGRSAFVSDGAALGPSGTPDNTWQQALD